MEYWAVWISLLNSVVFQNKLLPKSLNQNIDECIMQSLIYAMENGPSPIHFNSLLIGK